MPDLSSVQGMVSQGVSQVPGLQFYLVYFQSYFRDLSYFRYFNWRDVVSNAPLVSKVLFVACVFFLIVFLALVRRHIFRLTMNGAVFGVVVGVLIVLVAEAALVMGGKVVIGQGAGKNLDLGGISSVLGTGTGMGAVELVNKEGAADEVLQSFVNLPEAEAKRVYETICR